MIVRTDWETISIMGNNNGIKWNFGNVFIFIEIGISTYVCSWSFKCRYISFVKDTDFSKYLYR